MHEIMRLWPAAISVVLRHRMLCVGCPVASFHSLSDACRDHGLDPSVVIEDIMREIGAAEERP